MALTQLRDRAQRLRRGGKSIREITKTLNASKSTVSNWCRDIKLSAEQRNKLLSSQRSAAVRALMKASERRRRERIRATKKQMDLGAKDVGSLTKRDLYMVGLALYWGEGYKKGNEELGLTNSDPHIIRFYLKWMRTIYGIPMKDFVARVHINSLHEDRVRAVEDYWSDITHIPRSQFTAPSLIRIRARKNYSNFHEHFGTLRVKVRRSTALRRRILGSLSALSKI